MSVRESIQKHVLSPIQKKKKSHHGKMEIKFKRSDEIAKTITVNENQITTK